MNNPLYEYESCGHELRVDRWGDDVGVRITYDHGNYVVVFLPSDERRDAAQAIAGDEYRVVPVNGCTTIAQPDHPAPVDPPEVKAEALREAADDLYGDNGPERGSEATWLRERADRLWPDPAKVRAMDQVIREVILDDEPDAEFDDPEIAQLAHGLVLRGIEVPNA